MKKILEDPLQCVGCSSCASVCPTANISMKAKEGGFLYPEIDQSTCVSCGKCRNVCPVLAAKEKKEPRQCYALVDNREESRLKSASGAASILFAEQILETGGAFCGCRLDENLRAVHDVTDELDALDLYRDSKYVQSDMSLAWPKINAILKQGRKILISGTPCQIAAVKRRFGDREEIITCDFVCSGVPDPSVFELYKKALEKERGKAIQSFYFRDKTNGWKKSNIRVVYDDGSEQIITRKDSYYFKLFGNNLYFRDCCYNCRFKDFNTSADLTVGDYWGIERRYPEIDDDKGCSLVIVNTEKGEALLSSVLNKATIWETPLDFAIETHPKLEKSIHRDAYRGLFYKYYKGDERSLQKAIKRSTGRSIFDKIIRIISKIK